MEKNYKMGGSFDDKKEVKGGKKEGKEITALITGWILKYIIVLV